MAILGKEEDRLRKRLKLKAQISSEDLVEDLAGLKTLVLINLATWVLLTTNQDRSPKNKSDFVIIFNDSPHILLSICMFIAKNKFEVLIFIKTKLKNQILEIIKDSKTG